MRNFRPLLDRVLVQRLAAETVGVAEDHLLFIISSYMKGWLWMYRISYGMIVGTPVCFTLIFRFV